MLTTRTLHHDVITIVYRKCCFAPWSIPLCLDLTSRLTVCTKSVLRLLQIPLREPHRPRDSEQRTPTSNIEASTLSWAGHPHSAPYAFSGNTKGCWLDYCYLMGTSSCSKEMLPIEIQLPLWHSIRSCRSYLCGPFVENGSHIANIRSGAERSEVD